MKYLYWLMTLCVTLTYLRIERGGVVGDKVSMLTHKYTLRNINP